MLRKLNLSFALIALLTSFQVVSAGVSYKLTDSEDDKDCNTVLSAIEKSQLAAKSDQQICDVINSPVTDLLRGKNFRDIEWSSVSNISTSDKEMIAKKIYESRIEGKNLHLFAKNESKYLDDINNAPLTNVLLEQAQLVFGSTNVYAKQLRRKQCEPNYKGYDGIPSWGLFSDQSSTYGLAPNPNVPPGNLFYLDNRLFTFSILPDYWSAVSNISKKKSELYVTIWSVGGRASANNDFRITSQLVCAISIHK